MKTLAVILALVPVTSVFAEDIPCDQVVARFEADMDSEIQTFQQVAKYFGTNATNWTNMDSLIESGAFSKKKNAYSGAASDLAQMSIKNQNSTSERIAKLGEEKATLSAALQKCLTPVQN